ncbi:MAG: hypothetical protein EBR23_04110 [Planctomycetia bacterium]|nr:hypothetical protein [Planctomycetia bacterium]
MPWHDTFRTMKRLARSGRDWYSIGEVRELLVKDGHPYPTEGLVRQYAAATGLPAPEMVYRVRRYTPALVQAIRTVAAAKATASTEV